MNVVFCGAPGSGKGTQCSRLVRKKGFVSLSTGDLIRSVAAQGTDVGARVSEILESGRLLPDDMVLAVLKNALENVDSGEKVLFDGFPRTMQQASDLNVLLNSLDRQLTCVIILDVEREVLEKRLTGRFVCSDCSSVYNEFFNQPQEQGVCDFCGGCAFEKRQDDAPSVVRLRLEQYEERIGHLVEYYEGLKLLHFVDGNGDINNVEKRIDAILEGEA